VTALSLGSTAGLGGGLGLSGETTAGFALGALTRQAQRLAAEVKQQRRQARAAASALQRGWGLR